ncbi:TonB-dependent receptor [Shewanella intestini]|uniref:TonB-dependent receptor n=1 Tax=Shewanella intestini TaxID=2017544 RepID=A0ABS5I559_9GAMM|nr:MULTISPECIES: TonB-dependent receptor [Shewanella]MBR9729158.1 TonB-dependent receptor [Shewanella intestini]MRG37271.1 TonB-dependent receptor plug domain-containing protein [Shewanella sp. XMDDZSB0408]
MKRAQYKNTSLGAQAVAAALVFGAPVFASQAETTEKTTANAAVNEACNVEVSGIECEKNQSAEAIERIKVHGVKSSVYFNQSSGDIRRVADLIDTPQVITVLTQDQIQESGKTDLKDILSAQAGVTLGTGENGNAFGDRYIIRGHEARSDVFVDGLRDPGMTTRESFATEAVEITKGPSSTFAGRGSSGGAVNSVTKKASTSYNLGRVDLALGTDDHSRLTVDYNHGVSATVGLRINGLLAKEDKPGREGITRERKGVQLSAVYEPTQDLSFIADGYYLDANDVADLGSYFDQSTREPIADIPVYAQDSDFLDSKVQTFTLRTEYNIADNLTFYNATRVGHTENGYITTGVRGTTRSATDLDAPGANTLTLSTHQGNQDVDYFSTQFNLFWDTQLLGMQNKFVFGLEYTDQQVDNGVYDIVNANDTNCITAGRRGDAGAYCILDGNGNVVDDIDKLMGRSYTKGINDAEYQINTISAYFMDTVALTDELELFFGVRQDSFDYENDTSSSRNGDILYKYDDTLYNGHVGLVYSITDNGNIYANYSTATNINGGESDLGASCGYGGVCGTQEQASVADPEHVENMELGTKWMMFEDNLMFTASVFQITKSDVMESVGDSYSTLGTLNTGKNRVKGIEFGMVGNITPALSLQFSAAIMDSEILASFNEETIGLALSNFADESAYLQLRYQLNDTFVVGAGYTYQGEMYGGQPDTAAGYDVDNGRYSIVVPNYQVVDLFANYNATESLTFRLNVGNVLDEEYFTAAYRSGSFMYLGDARNARLSATYEF